MVKKLKVLASLLLLACLLLPMSTLSRAPLKFERFEGKQLEQIEYKNYVVSPGEKRMVPYLFALPFAVPFFLALAGYRRRVPSLWQEVLGIASLFPVFLIVSFNYLFARLSAGGYIAALMAVALLVLSLANIRSCVTRWRSGRQA